MGIIDKNLNFCISSCFKLKFYVFEDEFSIPKINHNKGKIARIEKNLLFDKKAPHLKLNSHIVKQIKKLR